MPHQTTQLYIDGKWQESAGEKRFDTINPANGSIITNVAEGNYVDVDAAVKAARVCLNSPNWGYASTGAQRAVFLRKLGVVISRRKDELARLDSLDMGKPLREAQADMNDAIAACEHFAQLAEKRDAEQDEVIDNGTNGDFITTIVKEPVGVVAAITPWNYPLLMGIWKVVPALAAGCTVVLKPSELAPLSCIILAEMCEEAGLPAGALNVISGGRTTGQALADHPGIDKVSFTGSVPSAQSVMKAAATNGPRAVCLELGGKSPLIVFEDADIDSAVDWIMTGILWGSGQVCSATSRVLVHKSIRDQLISTLLEKIAQIKIGDSLSEEMLAYEGPAMGPVVSEGQFKKIWGYIDEARMEGLQLLCGGERFDRVIYPGFFVPPTVFVDVPTTSKLWNEEIFGPVLCIREFITENDAVLVANTNEYGLAAAVFSADAARCDRVARALRAGIIWKNCSQPAFIQAPWGGMKKSGFGRELGRWGLEEFTCVKQVTGCNNGFSWSLWK